MIVLAHEALTGNFSRIPWSLMVLTERMGSLHSIIGALLSPIGLVSAAGVAAFAGITYEIIKTEEEIKKLNIAMSATGNFAGMSEKQFTAVSESISGMGLASTSAAKEIETGLVMSGKYSADIIGKMTLAISQYASVTGEETDKASSQLTRMFEDPVKAANVLDDQFHIMTYTDRLYVEQLVKVGDQQDAVRFTLDKLSAQLQGPASEAVSHITQLWREFGSAIDAVENKRLRDAAIDKIQESMGPSSTLTYSDARARAEAIYEADQRQSASAAQREGERQQAEQQAKNNALFLHGESEKYRTAEKLRDDYAKNIRARETADTAAVMNMTLAQLKAYDDKLIANYDAKHKDKKGPRQKVDIGQRTADNYMAGLVSEAASAQQEINNIIAGIDFTKLTKGEKQINDLRAQLAISDPKMRNGQRSNSSIQEEIAYRKKRSSRYRKN
ncbi:phage tail length tape measure family protein [Paludibacterium denitrificans]|uniref:Bacteriophage tail tape measure N-terminal domain-containing protein n=1 Tax=Paludibacterium denitrificans TaxID=2675226 RepID=A0A844GC32_9NEIS|nr:phage tail length tape measure family protein [Paludibacterium denitrificans]MTD34033.1 hypothetical protein [Paludibacterium denitrificans]